MIVRVEGGSLRYRGLRHDARGSGRWLGGDDGSDNGDVRAGCNYGRGFAGG